MPPILHTLFYFLVALAVLIAFHEFGHFIAARRLGVKVIRFSLGFGRPLWRYQGRETEFVLSAVPLGGYVKMVDEREGEVAPEDLAFAFNRQGVLKRSLIVFAGPLFNFLLAVLIYWAVFMYGETGSRPLLGPVAQGTYAQQAGFTEGDEILRVDGVDTPTWGLAMSTFLERVIERETIVFDVKSPDGQGLTRTLSVPREVAEQPELLHERTGFQVWQPVLPPLIDQVVPEGAAEAAGLKSGDLLLDVDGVPLEDWQQWVDEVRSHPGKDLKITVDRDGVRVSLNIKPVAVASPKGEIGQIGASVRVPEEIQKSMDVEYRLGFLSAGAAALSKTTEYSLMTLRMMGRMLIGKASVENLSGPISIAQYAGQSARMGVVHFLKFLAIVSISLAVLNLLPIPVLDGGHLLFYLVEAVKGSPVSEQTQAYCQQVGMFVLVSLMVLAFVLDIERLFS